MSNDLRTVAARDDVQQLQTVLDDLVVGKDWDLVLVGDGSGTSATKPCGWACALVSRVPAFRRLFFGYRNTGGVPYAELQAYVQALDWHWHQHGKAAVKSRMRVSPLAKLNAHILCDNKTTVEQGNGNMRRDNQSLQWLVIDAIVEMGYAVTWHWRPRNNSHLNKLCDRIAGISREQAILEENNRLESAGVLRVEQLNPYGSNDDTDSRQKAASPEKPSSPS